MARALLTPLGKVELIQLFLVIIRCVVRLYWGWSFRFCWTSRRSRCPICLCNFRWTEILF